MSRPDAHSQWLQHLHRETPLGHPAVRQADADWVNGFAQGYGRYPKQWSLASIQVRRKLTEAGWDVQKLMAEMSRPGKGLPAGPHGPVSLSKARAVEVRQAGGSQARKMLVRQNEEAPQRKVHRDCQNRPDAHSQWLQHLHRETPLGHPAVRQADADWVNGIANGYGRYPKQWSLASIQVRRELTAAGWDVQELMAEMSRPGKELPAGPSSAVSLSKAPVVTSDEAELRTIPDRQERGR